VKTMFHRVFRKQLLFLAVFLTLLILCQTLLFKSGSTSWVGALTTRPWLWIIYFLVTHITVEQVVRKRR
jgi:hypothetical protein